jgi:hypothetical protein
MSDPCVKCGQPDAPESFDLCADNNALRSLCTECDVELNALVLAWVGDPKARRKIKSYRRRKGLAV